MMLSSSSSDSSSDDEMPVVAQLWENVRAKNENYVTETVASYTDSVFQEHFRLSRKVTVDLTEQYRRSHYYHENCDGKYGALEASHQILMYLWFTGHQTSCFRDVADRFGCSISTLYYVIQKITYFLSGMATEIIQWPTEIEMADIENHFMAKGFPGVVGAIDGCHIKIDKPSDDPDSYMNRKKFYSLQMQVVCDHNRKIRDVFIGYPGSVHDSRVFRVSPLSEQLQERCGQNYFILGDSGYPCTNFLLTPFKDRGHLTPAQHNYNLQHAKCRYVIEHCFGVLKQRFRQLYHVKLRSINRIAHFIRACCVLHNIAIDNEVVVDENIGQVIEANVGGLDAVDEEMAADDRAGVARRNFIAEMLYNRE